MRKIKHVGVALIVAGLSAGVARHGGAEPAVRASAVADAGELAWPKDGPRKVWSVDVGVGYAGPAVDGGVVYTMKVTGRTEAKDGKEASGGQESVVAIDLATGKEKWSTPAGPTWAEAYAGSRAAPTVVGGVVYAMSGVGLVVAIEAGTGKVIWQRDAIAATGEGLGNFGRSSSPTVAGDLVLVQGAGQGSVVVALDRKSGNVVWKSEHVGMGGYAAVQAIGQTALVTSNNAAVAMDIKTGKTLWSVSLKNQYDTNIAQGILHDGKFFVQGAVDAGVKMYDVSGEKPKEVWKVKGQMESDLASPIRLGNRILLSHAGVLKALDWETGKVVWTVKDPTQRIGRGPFFVVGKTLVTLSERGRLSMLRLADGDAAPTVLGSAAIGEGKETWAMPVLVGRRLVARVDGAMMCLDLEDKP